jgi:hypothetical protein
MGLAMLLVAAAVAYRLEGLGGLRQVAASLFGTLPAALVLLALASLCRLAVPRGAATGPLLLLLAGLAGLAAQRDWGQGVDRRGLVPLLLAAGGAAVAFVPTGPRPAYETVVHRRSIALPRNAVMTGRPPRRVGLTCVVGRLGLDLTNVDVGKQPIEVYVTILGGRVEVVAPAGCPLLAGELASAHGTRFEGLLDEASPRAVGEQTRPPAPAVVVHVLGLFGTVVVSRGSNR